MLVLDFVETLGRSSDYRSLHHRLYLGDLLVSGSLQTQVLTNNNILEKLTKEDQQNKWCYYFKIINILISLAIKIGLCQMEDVFLVGIPCCVLNEEMAGGGEVVEKSFYKSHQGMQYGFWEWRSKVFLLCKFMTFLIFLSKCEEFFIEIRHVRAVEFCA